MKTLKVYNEKESRATQICLKFPILRNNIHIFYSILT